MLLCVDCVLGSSRIAQADPGRQTPHFWGGSVTLSVLKYGFIFWTILLLRVHASDALDPPMVRYLLELFWELPLAGPTMLMRRASMAGFQQVLPKIRSCFIRWGAQCSSQRLEVGFPDHASMGCHGKEIVWPCMRIQIWAGPAWCRWIRQVV
jgi:hypothetical protein